MFRIDSKSSIPIFEQIIKMISQYIAIGIYKPNDKLPSVRNLAKQCGVNPNTIAKAYQECDRLGLIYTQKGIGYFVSDTSSSLTTILKNAYQDLDKSLQNLINYGVSKEDIIKHIEEVLK